MAIKQYEQASSMSAKRYEIIYSQRVFCKLSVKVKGKWVQVNQNDLIKSVYSCLDTSLQVSRQHHGLNQRVLLDLPGSTLNLMFSIHRL